MTQHSRWSILVRWSRLSSAGEVHRWIDIPPSRADSLPLTDRRRMCKSPVSVHFLAPLVGQKSITSSQTAPRTQTDINPLTPTVIYNFWHSGTLTLRDERQSVLSVLMCLEEAKCHRHSLDGTTIFQSWFQMSKITIDGLTRSGAGCSIAVPIWQQWASKGYRIQNNVQDTCTGTWSCLVQVRRRWKYHQYDDY